MSSGRLSRSSGRANNAAVASSTQDSAMTSGSSTPRRALVVIDVQNEYFSGGNLPIEYPPIHSTLPNVIQAMDAAHEAGIPIVLVRHGAGAGAPIFANGSAGWQLHPEIARRPHDHLIDKQRASVFAGTDFAPWLARHEIDTLAVVGYMTHNCDAATIYEASHRGLKVEFLSDATGALPYANEAGRVTAEEIHRVYSVVFHTGFAAVVPTSAWIAAVRAGSALASDNVYASNLRAREVAVPTA